MLYTETDRKGRKIGKSKRMGRKKQDRKGKKAEGRVPERTNNKGNVRKKERT